MLASLSRVACLLLSKQSGVTARNNFSFHALVLPVKDGFSLKVFIITVCFQRRVFISLSRANKITFTQASIFRKHEKSNYSTLNDCLFQTDVVSQITCKFAVNLPSL